MICTLEVYGAKAIVHIDFDKTLKELGEKIGNSLNLKALRYENSEDEPYDLVGYSEVLGFELILKNNMEGFYEGKYHYSLEIISTDCFKEIMNDRIYDISLWFARYISMNCDLKTIVSMVNGESKCLTKFWYENPNRMSEVIEI